MPNGSGNQNQNIITTIITLVTGGGFVAIVAGVLKMLEYFRKNKLTDEDRQIAAKKEAKVEARSEYEHVLSEYKARTAAMEAQLSTHRQEAEVRVDSLRKYYDDKIASITSRYDAELATVRKDSADQINKFRDDAIRSRLESTQLRGYIQLLQSYNSQARGGTVGPHISDEFSGNIVSDEDGRITQADASVVNMFHYMSERDMIGKSLTVLMPPEFRALHEAGIAKVKASGVLPDGMKVRCLEGLTRDGQRFPIDLQLAAWKGVDGRFVYSATVRQRFDRELSEPVNPSPVATLPPIESIHKT